METNIAWTGDRFRFWTHTFDASRLNNPTTVDFLEGSTMVCKSVWWWSLMWNAYLAPNSVSTLDEA